MTIPIANSFLNAITFDANRNVYVSDSANGIIWTATGCMTAACPLPTTGSVVAKQWAGPDPLLMPPTDADIFPPVGANGIAFSGLGSNRLLVANTGRRNIIAIPAPTLGGPPGTPAVFVTGVNGPDGVAVQNDVSGLPQGPIWVAANNSDEIVVIDNGTGRVIIKLGDFNGLAQCMNQRETTCRPADNSLLFPASLAFSNDGTELYVTNFAFNQTTIGQPSIQSPWTALVKAWTVAKISTRIAAPGFPPP
jgi:sugar lactone lactonase YvrE